jgi:hypothetical protein
MAAPSDSDLLDFDYKDLSVTPATAKELLAKHGNTYRDQLVIARWLNRWRRDALETSKGQTDPKYLDGFGAALDATAAILRQGDLLHDGTIYLSETSR